MTGVQTCALPISYKGYNPMRFQSYEQGEANGSLNKVIKNELLYFPIKENCKLRYPKIGYNLFSAY